MIQIRHPIPRGPRGDRSRVTAAQLSGLPTAGDGCKARMVPANDVLRWTVITRTTRKGAEIATSTAVRQASGTATAAPTTRMPRGKHYRSMREIRG